MEASQPLLSHKLSELPTELRFAALRKQFVSAQMTVRDYMLASMRVARQNMMGQKDQKSAKHDHGLSHLSAAPDASHRLSDDQFVEIAGHAMSSALKFMSLASGATEDALKQSYEQICGTRTCSLDTEEFAEDAGDADAKDDDGDVSEDRLGRHDIGFPCFPVRASRNHEIQEQQISWRIWRFDKYSDYDEPV